jgi:hypothetical protein
LSHFAESKEIRMAPRPFYEVKPASYLFGRAETPEEKVRQWALFELLSTYGIHINNIEIEKPVRVGTRIHRADIVILREQIPHVVIECKEQEHDDHSKAIEQGISYAATISAEFSIYTNGSAWIVKRRLGEKWETVPDIGKQAHLPRSMGIVPLLQLIHNLTPLLYWLHQSVPANQAQNFLRLLQDVLYQERDFFNTIDRDLRHATEFLLTVLSTHPFGSEDYETGKMRGAAKGFSNYCARIGLNLDKGLSYHRKPDIWDIDDLARFFESDLSTLVLNSREIKNEEVYLLRLTLALVRYLQALRKAKQYLDISQGTIDEFRSMIESLCNSKLGVVLPDPLDDLFELRIWCSDKWEQTDTSL